MLRHGTVSMLCLTWLLTGGIRFQQHAARQPPLQCSTVLFAASFATHNGTVYSHRFLFSLLYFTHLRLSSFSSISRTYLGYPVKKLTVCGDCPSKIINTTTTTSCPVLRYGDGSIRVASSSKACCDRWK